ncbi:hypothetical protein [Sphingopyxis sp. Geo25]|uniref:hypothetical protein n=1 Tax=Sphingopyxis sp. Geo25 TaxID=3032247 RepID=UPI0024B70805|nr:hypothetical protein [Sphingopyxis sp. Geo25]
MPSQPDLLAITLDDVVPAPDQSGPRLWVRRLVIWGGVGNVIRDVTLRPGLNIIWSPDSGKDNEAMGHGGGKTSFCRLLRYCLGENSFGSQTLREMIARQLPDGYVGAEIVLDGETWIVVRPIGTGNRHYCAKGEALDDAFVGDMANTGIAAFRDAVTQALMTEAASRMPLLHPSEEAWEVTLAWLTRDQECRLLAALDWRAAQTQSQSASRQRQLSKEDRLVIVRLLINALSAAEMTAAKAARDLGGKIEQARNQRRRLEYLVEDLQAGLSQKFGGIDAQPDFWKEKATEVAQAVESAVDPELQAKLVKARSDRAAAEKALQPIYIRLAEIDKELASKGEFKKILDNAAAKAHTHVYDVQNPVCKTCGQKMDQAAQDFVTERQQEKDDVVGQLTSLANDISGLTTEKDSLKYQQATAEQGLAPLADAVIKLEKALIEQSKRQSEAKGDVAMSTRYTTHLGELQSSAKAIEELTATQGEETRKATEQRNASLQTVARLSLLFDAVLKFLIPDGASGTINLDQNDLNLRLQMGGERSTAAVDSLKIVAFDLAALLLTIEGRTQLPAFLIHDSPREADLGLSIYNRLFMLGDKLEGMGPSPLFQYIVTTTTAPPEAYRKEPWQRLELHGAPPDKRLFAADL